MTQTYFKVLDADGCSRNGGDYQWSLPVDGQPGEWTPEREVIPCTSGWHLCVVELQLLEWLGPRIWVAEVSGEVVHDEDKVVVSRCRLVAPTAWDDRSARLFAADCAEHVLPLFEAEYPDDKRPQEAIAAARAFARGEIGESGRRKACNAAWEAWEDVDDDAATCAAAYTAARAAAYAASCTANHAADAAAYAAADTAYDAVIHADAGREAERAWQAERLAQYVRGDLN